MSLRWSPCEAGDELLAAVDVVGRPVSAVFGMTWMASAATAAGPTTRLMGSVARS